MRRIISILIGILGVGLLAVMIGVATEAATLINGAGATFPFPLYSKWFSEFHKVHSEVQINYQSIGSGGGIRQFTAHTIDFGATDIPMTEDQLTKSSNTIIHIPTVVGAVVLTYHLPGVGSGLKLSPEVIADLFLGKIQNWNDARISEMNPGVKLPTQPVTIVRRSDGSGTTAIFTDYLSKVSSDWKSRVGSGTAVNWPVGLGGKGNEGVSGLIQQTPGAIGYAELVFAEINHLSIASIKNRSGQFIVPDLKSVTLAAASIVKSIPQDYRVSITDPSLQGAYPISAFTYLLVHSSMTQEKGEKIITFLKWALGAGQDYAKKLYYAPLPSEMIKKVNKTIETIHLTPDQNA
jgi:phosphate transport system substrate-binding protein